MGSLISNHRRRNALTFLAILVAAAVALPIASAITFDENFQSRPGSPNVLYIDFRGGTTVARSGFNNGQAWSYPAINLEKPYIDLVLQVVAEYFRPFDVNVTTNFNVYSIATGTKKVRIRVTQKERIRVSESPDVWGDRIVFDPKGIGGVFVGTGQIGWDKSSPAQEEASAGWAFFFPPSQPPPFNSNTPFTQDVMVLALSITHELGHAIGLQHWSTTEWDSPGTMSGDGEYYPRAGKQHGSEDWVPMMGADGDGKIVQWSKGEFANSGTRVYRTNEIREYQSPKQDDVAVLLSRFGYAPGIDPEGNTTATASPLPLQNGVPHGKGFIHAESDQDWFSFNLSAGINWVLNVNPLITNFSLDVEIEIRNAAGDTVAFSAPTNTFSASVSLQSLPAGQYFLGVRGGHQGNPATDGWSAYGSLGSYVIQGKISSDTIANAPLLNESKPPAGTAGVAYFADLRAANSPVSASTIPDFPLPPGLSLNTTGGQVTVTGAPTQSGSYSSLIFVQNAVGGTAKEFQFYIWDDVPLSRAVDAPDLPWTTYTSPTSSVPSYLWRGQAVHSSDLRSSARSGNRGHNGESWLETFVTGPGLLKFKWATDSETGDELVFYVDNIIRRRKHGRLNSTPAIYKEPDPGTVYYEDGGAWSEFQIPIGNGGHYIRWNYRKDPGISEGEDAGFVDQVQFIPAPGFTAYRHLVTVVGYPALHNLHPYARNTTYAVNSGTLPAGLNLETGSGAIVGMPVSPGSSVVGFSATNEGGTNTTTKTIHVFPNVTLTSALDGSGINWYSDGDNGWVGILSPAADGADSARSGPLDANGTSRLVGEVGGEGSLSFEWKTASDVNDKVRFYIDDVFQHELSGNQDWQQKTYTVNGPGAHRFKWEFKTDGSGGTGNDIAYLDRVTWTSGFPAVITGPTSDTAEEGQPYFNQITATGATLYGYSGGAISGLAVHPQTGAITGTPTTPGQQSMTLTASNAAGGSSIGFSLFVQPSPQTALDTTALAFTRPDAKKWFGQMAVNSDGMDAMQSPALGHGESSSIETTVTGPGTINYYWRADTEPADKLTLTIGSSVVDSIFGNAGWISRSQPVPAGVQTLRWTFRRDGNGDAGSNTVWLDRVSFTGATGPTITSPLTVFWTCGQFYYVPLTSDDPATVWSVDNTVPVWAFFATPPSNAIGAVPRRPGTFSFPIFATNSLGTTTRAFTMYVQSAYTGWAQANGLGTGSELGDQDKDGLNNFAEVALGLDPKVRTNGYQPVSYDAATKRLRAVFLRRTPQYFPDIKYEVQVSNNLQTWTTIAQFEFGDNSLQENLGAQSITLTAVGSDEQMTVVDGVAQTAGTPRRWMRVKVSQMLPAP